MKLPPFYTLFCVAILGVFTYGKYQGFSLFGAGAAATTQGGGSHVSGVFIGSHK
jgi:hypothetical protein